MQQHCLTFFVLFVLVMLLQTYFFVNKKIFPAYPLFKKGGMRDYTEVEVSYDMIRS
ncbi:hypothetical protein EVA_08138 [gut metagenome]|uniref:Uncharacterized protein n=1 Tax=gut metagenome TaxID=749906 RepID=J9G930_9ZZZZ